MARFARIDAGLVAELIDLPEGALPADRYHAAIASTLVPASDAAVIGGEWDGETFSPPPAPQPGAPIRHIAPLAFRRRISAEVRAAITLAASLALEQGDATLQVFLDDLSASRFVDLDDPATEAGVAALLAATLITQEQADALLADGTVAERA